MADYFIEYISYFAETQYMSRSNGLPKSIVHAAGLRRC